MSLIYFHIFLMSAGIIFSFVFGFWELGNYSTVHKIFDLGVGLVSFLFSGGLAVYLAWFIKTKKPFMK